MTESRWVIRDFRLRDQDSVQRLILEGLQEHWGELNDALNPDLEDLSAAYAHGRTIVIGLGDELPGTGTLVPVGNNSAEIVRMSVRNAHRRTGIGRALVEELVLTAQRWSVTSVVLETQSSWKEVIAFYEACGFEITGELLGEFGPDTLLELSL